VEHHVAPLVAANIQKEEQKSESYKVFKEFSSSSTPLLIGKERTRKKDACVKKNVKLVRVRHKTPTSKLFFLIINT
jgi:hypothetical protein